MQPQQSTVTGTGMTLYHGTTIQAARAILSEGIWPNGNGNGSSFKLVRLDDYSPVETSNGFVFLSQNPDGAKRFASFRAKFDRAKDGDRVLYGAGNVPMVKLTNWHQPTARPAIVRVNIPETVTGRLVRDWGVDFSGWKYPGIVLPEWINGVLTLGGKEITLL